jgi:hypothetical protein
VVGKNHICDILSQLSPVEKIYLFMECFSLCVIYLQVVWVCGVTLNDLCTTTVYVGR